MTTNQIWTIIVAITVIITILSIGYFIWFMTYWNRLRIEREEMIRDEWEKILMKSLSKKDKEDV